MIPDYPDIGADGWARISESKDPGFLLFEWYRWTGNLATVVAFIRPDSQDFANISKREYHLVSGLMARCSRLMLSIVALTHRREFGEAALIIHRSLMETAVKLIWVSEKEPAQRTAWLIASGLRPEIEFERYILAGIESNGGEKTALETRMLDSIQNNFDAAEINRDDVENSKRLPDLSSMFEDIGWSRLQYVILQRLGSHAVHGNWPSLLADYLEETDIDGYDLMPRGQPVNLHPNVYMTGARLVLSAVAAYSRHCLKGSAAEDFEGLAEEAYEKLMQDYKRAVEFGL